MAHVGSVVLPAETGTQASKGDEIGYLQFGGSDIILPFQAGVNPQVDTTPPPATWAHPPPVAHRGHARRLPRNGRGTVLASVYTNVADSGWACGRELYDARWAPVRSRRNAVAPSLARSTAADVGTVAGPAAPAPPFHRRRSN